MASRRLILPGPMLEWSAKSILKRTTGLVILGSSADHHNGVAPLIAPATAALTARKWIWQRTPPRFAINDIAVIYMAEYNERLADNFQGRDSQRGQANAGPGLPSLRPAPRLLDQS
jgi:hypothetical protein